MSTKKPSKKSLAKKNSEKQVQDRKLPKNLELKLSVVFAGLAMLANVLIFFFAILPTYGVIDGESTSSISDTLDRSETITNVLTPIIFLLLALATILLFIGMFKYVRTRSKSKSRSNSSKNS